MKYPCPKCLLALRNANTNSDLRHRIDRALSVVCNAALVGPRSGDPCCCGAGWIPCMPSGRVYCGPRVTALKGFLT